jgi:hypothetical protein
MTRADLILVLIAVAALCFLYSRYWVPGGDARFATVRTQDSEAEVLDLTRDRKVSVTGPLGKSVIEIRDGRIRFSGSPCTGRICVHTGWLHEAGEVAVCLPNRVSIQLSGDDTRFDAINF